MTDLKRLTLVLMAFASVALARSAAAQAYSEERLKQACATLQQAPLDSAATLVLLDASKLATNAPALRSRAMAAYSLTLLMRGNTNAFERAAQIHRETFPADHALLTVNADAYLVVCGDCAGSGMKQALCPTCMGSGTCKTCGGTGVKKSADGQQTPCAVCKRSGACAMCAGKRRFEAPCPTCKGAGRVFKLSEKVRSNYVALLTNMTALCDENAAFALQWKQAQSETDADARIGALQTLLQQYAHRSDLGPSRDLLAKTLKAKAARLAEQRQQQELEQSQRDLEALRNLRDAPDSARAMATLRAYLSAHPQSPNKIELQSMLDEFADKEAHKQTVKKVALGAVALVAALLLIQAVRPLLIRTRASGVGTVRDIDKSVYTDPLTLTSEESKARDHSGTNTDGPNA